MINNSWKRNSPLSQKICVTGISGTVHDSFKTAQLAQFAISSHKIALVADTPCRSTYTCDKWLFLLNGGVLTSFESRTLSSFKHANMNYLSSNTSQASSFEAKGNITSQLTARKHLIRIKELKLISILLHCYLKGNALKWFTATNSMQKSLFNIQHTFWLKASVNVLQRLFLSCMK